MCGVFGFASEQALDGKSVLQGLRSLEYRGYDSWGVAQHVSGKIVVEKQVGSVPSEEDSPDLLDTQFAFGHTRWATHGGVTQANAHPHLNEDASVAVVHNGIVENYRELKASLVSSHTFVSDTDSEVIVHLYDAEREKAPTARAAFRSMFQRLKGLNAIVLFDAREGVFFVAKEGSPLVLGIAENATFFASDALAFLPYTQQAVFLEDGQAAEVSLQRTTLFSLATNETLSLTKVEIPAENIEAGKGSYDNFMQKEIAEQPGVIRTLAALEESEFSAGLDLLRDAHQVVITGCGTAYHASVIGAQLLSSALNKRVQPVLASQFTETMLPYVDERTVVIVLSQSGETIDVVEPVSMAQKKGVKVLSLVNVPYSSLYRMADVALVLQAGPERAVASTKAFTAKVAYLWRLAAALSHMKAEEVNTLLYRTAQSLEKLIAAEHKEERLVSLAKRLADESSIYVLGNGLFAAVAQEVALKIKEISYIHAEGLAASELKHGTLALIEPGFATLLLSGEETEQDVSASSAQEVTARGGELYQFGAQPFTVSKEFWETHPSLLGSILGATVLGQLFAYHLTRVKGLDPDKPRNLAKSVTVK